MDPRLKPFLGRFVLILAVDWVSLAILLELNFLYGAHETPRGRIYTDLLQSPFYVRTFILIGIFAAVLAMAVIWVRRMFLSVLREPRT